MENKITVIVPVYNIQRFISKCIDSVLNQTYGNFELLLIDDGSTDGSGKICDEAAENDGRVRVIRKSNGGLQSAWREGVKNSRCEYLAFVDGDDFIEPDMLEVMMREVERTDADIIVCDYWYEQEDKRLLCDFGVSYGVYAKENGFFKNLKLFPSLVDGRYFSGTRCNKLFKKDAFLKGLECSDASVNLGEDIAAVMPVIMACKKISYINKPLYHYIQHSLSMIHNVKTSWLDDWKKFCKCIKTASDKFNYPIDNFGEIKLSFFFSAVLAKTRHNAGNKKIRKGFLKLFVNDNEVQSLVKSVKKCKKNIKTKALCFCIRHRIYLILGMK